MKIGKEKTKRILLSLLLCCAISSSAYADGERITVESGETYEGAVTGTYSDLDEGVNNGGAVENNGTIGAIGDAEGTEDTVFTGNTAARDGGAVYNGSSAEIGSIVNVTFEENNTTSTTTSYGGGAIYNSGTIGSETDGGITDSTFTGNTSGSHGGAIYNTGTIYTIKGSVDETTGTSVFQGNAAGNSGHGGAIYSTGSIVSIDGVIFTENTATGAGNTSGGAIANMSGGTIGSITGSIFTENEAGFGGAIYNNGSASSIGTIGGSGETDAVTFTGNSAGAGGAIWSNTSIGSIEGSTFTENIASNNSGTTGGGAIYNSGTIGTEGGAGISNSTFTDNTSGRYGGAIFSSGTIISITGSEFSGNGFGEDAEGNEIYTANGGAIYNSGTIGVEDSESAAISNSIFTENQAGKSGITNGDSGGAIYNSGSIYGIEDTVFTANTSIADSASSGGGNGGAIYNSGTITYITGTITGEGEEAESTASFTGNYASRGGAVYNTSAGSIGSIGGVIFDANKAQGGSYGGGAISNAGSIGEITGSIFTDNATTIEGGGGGTPAGGAIDNSGSIGTISDSTFDSNVSITSGGAISNNGSIGNIVNTTFTKNVATNDTGGAIYSVSSGSTSAAIGTIENCTFSWNTANSHGGAIYARETEIGSIVNSTFEYNDSYGEGGALYNGGGTIGSIEGVTFTSNYADLYGGAIRNYGTINEIKGYEDESGNTVNTTFTGNWSYDGGAIYNYNNGTIGTIDEGTVFDGNYVTDNGGAIYNSQNSSIEKITGTAFTKNEAQNGDGGAIYNYDDATIGSIENSTFTENKAANDGGAIYNFWETETGNGKGIIGDITGSTFASNSAVDYGGAIFNRGYIGLADDGETVTGGISDSTFTGNESIRGGAIYNGIQRDAASTGGFDSIITSIENCYFYQNVADAFGGAIYNYDDGYIWNISNNVFEENTARDGNGGAIENAEAGSVIGTISNNQFLRNDVSMSDHGGGAIYSEGIIESITGNNFEENKSGNYGGAFYNNGGTVGDESDETADSITGNTFTGNESGRGGAIYNTANRSVDESGTETIDPDAPGIITNINNNTFTGNIADNYGGAIYNYSYGQIWNISDNTFEENVADNGNGGAIENAESTSTIGTIRNNQFLRNDVSMSEHGGGAIYNEGSIAVIGENNFEENTSYNFGGAIYNNGGTIDTDETGDSITGNTFTGNTSNRGGAIYNTAHRTVDESGAETIDENTPGVILSIDNNTFSGNIANDFGGAIYNYKYGEIKSITGNTFEANEARGGNGGAIENAEPESVIGEISGNTFTKNTSTAGGAAIYNEGTIDTIKDNKFEENQAGTYGGAIYNNGGTISEISGDTFTGNSAVSEDGEAAGGAIYNSGTISTLSVGDLTGNYAKAGGGNGAAGGAIFYAYGTSGDITVTGAVSGNYATSSAEDAGGGAIYTESEDVNITIKGDVTDNYAKTTADGGSALGGAIYSQGTTDVTGAITGNYVEGSDDAGGGAIYNEGTLTVNATSVENNHAISSAGAALAGAIYTDSEDSVINVTGNVTGNYVKAEAGEATGGAIYSLGTTTIEGDVTDNYAEGADVQGGAIYAGENSTVNLYGNITGNYAKGDTALGGAIYNADGATVNIYVENKDSVISGNYVESGGEKEANVLYGEADSVTNFILTDATLRVDDGITGDTGFEVNIKGNGTDATTFYMYNDILDSNLSFAGTTLNTINNEVKTYSVNKFTVAGDFNMVADVDLANESMDRFVTNGNNYGEAKGSLNVSGMNLISDTEKDRVGIYFAEPGLKEDVTSSVGQLPGSEQQTVYTPLYEYDVTYDKNYDGSWGDDGGYFVFDKQGNNPAAMVPTIAQMGLFNAMNMMFEYCFEHSDYYMKLPSETRLAIREKAKAARAAKLAAKNGTTVEEETEKIDDARAEEMASREGVKFYDHDNVLPLYDQHELTRPGAWVKPFATKESIPFTGKFTARDKYYGALIGVDSDFREDKKGWGNVFTGYAGYQGIHQSFSGGSVRQDGGLLGATETFYKKNFYTAWTVAAASTRAKARNMYGHESSRLYTYGIASKSGWNLEYDDGKYIVLPTFMVSYTNVDMRSYTNAAGLRVDADDMRAVQLNPNIKWIRNYDNGWQPYLTAGEIWTVGQKSRVRVDGTELDKLHLRPYTEYGIGVQKRWANEYDGYAEFLGHAGGRRGFLAKLGFRWTFN